MKKILCAALMVLAWAYAVHAMELDTLKRHFLNSDWKAGIREGESLLAKAGRDTAGLDELYYYLALCYMKDGNYLRTSDICEIILNEFPKTKFREQAHFVLIDAYANNDNVSAASSHAQDFLKKYPESIHKKDVETLLSRLNKRRAAQPMPPVSVPIPSAPVTVTASAAVEPDIVLAPDVQQEAVSEEITRQLWVQVGAFLNNRNAGNLAKKLRAASYNASVVKSASKGKTIFKVRVGPYYTKAEVNTVSKKLSRQGYPTKIIP